MNRMTQPDPRAGRNIDEPRRDTVRERPRGVLVAFPGPDARRNRRAPRADEARGEILLFLGVRYERRAS